MLFFLPLAALLLVVARARSPHRPAPRRSLFTVARARRDRAVDRAQRRRPPAVRADRLVRGGVNFWIGNHREAIGEGDLAANPHLKLRNVEFRARHAGLSEEALEPLYYREALGFIAADPVWWLGLEARKLWYTFVPFGPVLPAARAALFLGLGGVAAPAAPGRRRTGSSAPRRARARPRS